MSTPIIYSIVVPVYNSGPIVNELVNRTRQVMLAGGYAYEIILIDDCSKDNSWEKIKTLADTHPEVTGYRLSNNFGQWMSTMAGISKSVGKYIITIDDDLEYDPADIHTLIQKYQSGDYYIVFGLAPDKYRLQGKINLLARLRNKFINIIWQKYLTDSFKIFRRELLFDHQNTFAPKVHFEAFINFVLDERFVGYTEVGYHKRFEGSSNHTVLKKIGIFYRYSLDYYRFPSKGLSVILAFLFVLAMGMEYIVFRGSMNGLLLAFMSLAQVCLLLLILQYVAQTYLRTNHIPDYWIIEDTKTK